MPPPPLPASASLSGASASALTTSTSHPTPSIMTKTYPLLFPPTLRYASLIVIFVFASACVCDWRVAVKFANFSLLSQTHAPPSLSSSSAGATAAPSTASTLTPTSGSAHKFQREGWDGGRRVLGERRFQQLADHRGPR